jgi:hypothetical protein
MLKHLIYFIAGIAMGTLITTFKVIKICEESSNE